MFDAITTEVLSAIIILVLFGLGSFFAVLYRCVRKQGQRGYRQSQAILLLTQTIEEQTKINHPEYSEDLTGKVELILKDENGNL